MMVSKEKKILNPNDKDKLVSATLELLTGIHNEGQLRWVSTEVIRRLFPSSQCTLVAMRRDHSPTTWNRMSQLLSTPKSDGLSSCNRQMGSHTERRTKPIAMSSVLHRSRSKEQSRNRVNHKSREEMECCRILVLETDDLIDNHMMKHLLLRVTEQLPQVVLASVAMGTIEDMPVIISFQVPAFGDEDRTRLDRFLIELSEHCNGDFMFLLFPVPGDASGRICPATSEKIFPSEMQPEMEYAIFNEAAQNSKISNLNDRDQIRKIFEQLTAASGSGTERDSWAELSCFAVHLSLEDGARDCQINNEGDKRIHNGPIDSPSSIVLICVATKKATSSGKNRLINRSKKHHLSEDKRKKLTNIFMKSASDLHSSYSTSMNKESDHLYRLRVDTKSDHKSMEPVMEDILSKGGPVQYVSFVERLDQMNRRVDSRTFYSALRLHHRKKITILVQFNAFASFTEQQKQLFRGPIADYLTVAFSHYFLLRDVHSNQHRMSVIEEQLAYHVKGSDKAVETLCRQAGAPARTNQPEFNKLIFLTRSVPKNETTQATVSMFIKLQLTQQWRIPLPVLAQFVLTVESSYRDPAYHNWMHAFCVGHFAYLCMHNAAALLKKYLTPLEHLALLVGALCHDIDHRGFSNSYQILTDSPLAALYGADGSILENHHIDHSMRILRMDECNIFVNLTAEENQTASKLVRKIILATDLATHLRILPSISAMATQGYHPGNADHHHYLLSLLATASDLSDQCKPWINTRIAASQIYTEFFHQGDCERQAHHMQPISSMDRSEAFIPELQIHFLDTVVLPCFRNLSNLIPECSISVNTIQRNRTIWDRLCELIRSGQLPDYSTDRLFAGHYDRLVEQMPPSTITTVNRNNDPLQPRLLHSTSPLPRPTSTGD